ncbi:unnamed protein product [Gongylonema pulchrum]|uniref:RPN7 domain-containing protein n=1 Tax=Gongylonema pulchrum TaxID=637853 RepID=A0A183DXY9_9BILA|nr:unnamed protein product [Gongylonema pulchrum]
MPMITVNTASVSLDEVQSSYKGHGLINRLLFVSEVCLPLQKDALIMLIRYLVENTVNVQTYALAHHRLELLRGAAPVTESPGATFCENAVDGWAHLDSQWMDKTSMKAQTQLDVLIAEFNRQKEEGVKESTRRAFNDVFEQHIAMGQLQEAAKLYSHGIREYCTSPKHVIQVAQ